MYCGVNQIKRAENQKHQQQSDSPLQIKLIKMLGLKNYMLDKFVFRRKHPTYAIRSSQGKNVLFLDLERYYPPPKHQQQIEILEVGSHSVPVVRLLPSDLKEDQVLPCIIYSHGNSSDMGDSLYFVSKMATKFRAEWIVFDYTGYGESRKKEVGEQIICKDLSIVIAWSNRALQHIIVWGFSLGSFPTVFNAATYKLLGCILQCPIGSLSCMFYDQYAIDIKFKEDRFANIDYIQKVNSKILMMHSTTDEIIPIQQARLLYKKVVLLKGDENMDFIQVQNIKHNQFHRYLSANAANDLQNQLLNFLQKISVDIQPQKTKDKNQQEETTLSIQTSLPKQLQTLQQQIKEVKLQTKNISETQIQLVQQEQQIKCRPTTFSSKDMLCCISRK